MKNWTWGKEWAGSFEISLHIPIELLPPRKRRKMKAKVTRRLRLEMDDKEFETMMDALHFHASQGSTKAAELEVHMNAVIQQAETESAYKPARFEY